jgi:hypothetical protein
VSRERALTLVRQAPRRPILAALAAGVAAFALAFALGSATSTPAAPELARATPLEPHVSRVELTRLREARRLPDLRPLPRRPAPRRPAQRARPVVTQQPPSPVSIVGRG